MDSNPEERVEAAPSGEEPGSSIMGSDDAEHKEGVRQRVAAKLTSGFSTIEKNLGGFGGDATFEAEWVEHQRKVMEYFASPTANPADPEFKEVRPLGDRQRTNTQKKLEASLFHVAV